jgi:glutathione S-transferase
VNPGLPILWSFRRCPYAIRARLALQAAGVAVDLREVSLQAKPEEMLEVSPKGTVPVLVLPAPAGGQGRVIDQSLEVMRWALEQSDPQDLLRRGQPSQVALIDALIATNDDTFKVHLDRFKYASRFPAADPAVHREAALAVLRGWNGRLETAGASRQGGWLLGARPCLADLALLPFVRQFRLADPDGFNAEAGLEALRGWLGRFLAGEELAVVMTRQQRWLSSRFLYHLALAEDWQAALAAGAYRRSTRGRSLEEVGFVHASCAHQVAPTYRRFYADAGPVRLLTIDPQRLTATVKQEPAPESGELFPHIHGPLPLVAVVRVEPYPE